MHEIKLADYYNRYDPAKNYDRLAFRATRTAQSAEQNEMQDIWHDKLRNVADALFKDGDIIRGAVINYNAQTGRARCGAGLVYLAGAVRAVPEGELAVPPEGVAAIGLALKTEIITELEDPELYNPAIGTRSEGEPGAARVKVTAAWALAAEGASETFYPVYTVEEGELQAKEPPPNLDALTQALARYDRDSAGGTYVISGLTARIAPDSEAGHQVYTVSEGRARVFGYPVELATSRRLIYPTEPETLEIEAEVHLAAGAAEQRLVLDRYPVGRVTRVRLTRETTENVTHGGYTGAADPLSHNSVTKIVEVRQGNVTFTVDADYRLTAGKVDWSPAGPEPSPHSTYTVTYQYMATENNPAADLAGLVVQGAVADTHIFVDYFTMLPRFDCLCLNRDGQFLWVPGAPSPWSPQRPPVADDLLLIATVHQTWDDRRRLVNDGVRVVPMNDIAAINHRLDDLTEQVARQRLEADLFTREAGAKRGLFVDPFLSDQMRDQGLQQSAAVVGGCLTLPVELGRVMAMAADLARPARLPYVPAVALEQLLRTGEMKINPYDALEPLPAEATLTPAIDRWTDIQTDWASPVTQQFDRTLDGYYHVIRSTTSVTATETLSRTTSDLEFLRPIEVGFKLAGLGPRERVSITFDGLAVLPVNDTADQAGVLASSFRIPPKIPAGAKSVVFTGSGGSRGQAVFVGQGQVTVQVLRNVTSQYRVWVDPLAQTFALAEACQVCGVELWFTKKHTSRVVVQIRETTVGLPNTVILGEAVLQPSDLRVDGSATRAIFNVPVMINAETEYALVVMCDDSVTAVAVAELGKWDTAFGRWVTSQPYQIGVLLSSSNASTWTAHQTQDLTFRLLKAVYSEIAAEIDLGQVEVENATDLMILPLAEQPSPQTRVEFRLTLPDDSVLSVSDRQGLRLAGPARGRVGIKARLSGSAAVSPVVYPGAQLVYGQVGQTADYISRAIPAGPGTRAKVILEADLPAGSAVRVFLGEDGGPVWEEANFISSRPLDEGWQELVFEGLTDALLVRVKLVLSGNSAARPRVDNLRVLTI